MRATETPPSAAIVQPVQYQSETNLPLRVLAVLLAGLAPADGLQPNAGPDVTEEIAFPDPGLHESTGPVLCAPQTPEAWPFGVPAG